MLAATGDTVVELVKAGADLELLDKVCLSGCTKSPENHLHYSLCMCHTEWRLSTDTSSQSWSH